LEPTKECKELLKKIKEAKETDKEMELVRLIESFGQKFGASHADTSPPQVIAATLLTEEQAMSSRPRSSSAACFTAHG
jgi:hypothetical protein